MNTQESITKGIAAHGMWKQRILDAIRKGESKWTPNIVKQDNQCEFGKWLYSCTTQEKSSPHFQTIKALHAKFHEEAASVLSMAISGKGTEATKAIGVESKYKDISSQLTREMMRWNSALK